MIFVVKNAACLLRSIKRSVLLPEINVHFSRNSSESGDLKIDTGSFEYSDIKDKDRSYSVGGGVSLGYNETTTQGQGIPDEKAKYSVDGNYSLRDKRQTNFATVGEGEIIVRDGEADLSGLNRDVSISQYTTKEETGLEGSFRVDDETVNFVWNVIPDVVQNPEKVWKGLVGMGEESWEGLGEFWQDTKDVGAGLWDVAGKTKDLIFGDGDSTDEEVGNENEISVKSAGEENKSKENKAKYSMNGDEIEVLYDKIINEDGIFDQSEFKKDSCTFMSSVIEIIRASGSNVEITLDDFQKIYEIANAGKDPVVYDTMYVQYYQKLANITTDYFGIGRVTIPEDGIWISDASDIPKRIKPVSNAVAVQDMVKILESGGRLVVRFDGHSVGFNGYKIIENKLIFTVVDTGKNSPPPPPPNTHYDPETRQMFRFENPKDETSKRISDPSRDKKRFFANYRAIEKNKK